MKAVPSIPLLKIKFPTDFRVDQVILVDPREVIEVLSNRKCDPNEDIEEIPLFDNLTKKTVKFGVNLSSDIRGKLISTLRDFAGIFSWNSKDMPGISEDVALHKLNMKPVAQAFNQKMRIFSILITTTY